MGHLDPFALTKMTLGGPERAPKTAISSHIWPYLAIGSVHVVIDERARTDMLEGRFFQHLIGTWISLNIFGGLRLKKIDSSIPLPATGLCT